VNINLQTNKENVIDFYRMAYQGNPAKAVERYAGDQYVQHNPIVGDGKQAFIDYSTEMASNYPVKEITFLVAVAEWDLVTLHTPPELA
jgi:predicted SnoaL-like aldol condensation-catalyzing enzyme